MLVLIQQQSKLVPTNEFGERIKHKRREFYSKLEEALNKMLLPDD
jgi:hypothetical protein